jgi:hypothetical protein
MSPKCCQNEILSSIVCSNCISEESDEEKENEKDRLLEEEGKPTSIDILFLPPTTGKKRKGRRSMA